MPKIRFLPSEMELEVDHSAKILAVAVRNKIPLRFGCGACKCGTCAVAIVGSSSGLLEMEQDELELLKSMGLNLDGSHRLACRTKLISGLTVVDSEFQYRYSPDSGLLKDD